MYAVPAVLQTYGGSKLGYSHEHNEDRFVIEEDLGVLCGVGGGGRPSHRTALLAVFDGHGGAGAASYLQRCVAGAVRDAISRRSSDLSSESPSGLPLLLRDALVEACALLEVGLKLHASSRGGSSHDEEEDDDEDERAEEEGGGGGDTSGATAAIVVVHRGVVAAATVGDCQVLLCNAREQTTTLADDTLEGKGGVAGKEASATSSFSSSSSSPSSSGAPAAAKRGSKFTKFRALTTPHRSQDAAEARRLTGAGATLDGGRAFGLLEPSRAFGDWDVKRDYDGSSDSTSGGGGGSSSRSSSRSSSGSSGHGDDEAAFGASLMGFEEASAGRGRLAVNAAPAVATCQIVPKERAITDQDNRGSGKRRRTDLGDIKAHDEEDQQEQEQAQEQENGRDGSSGGHGGAAATNDTEDLHLCPFLVLGSDGLFDFASHEKVFEFARCAVAFDREPTGDLVDMARKAGSPDDLSAVVAVLPCSW